jgi:hypothetical protein
MAKISSLPRATGLNGEELFPVVVINDDGTKQNMVMSAEDLAFALRTLEQLVTTDVVDSMIQQVINENGYVTLGELLGQLASKAEAIHKHTEYSQSGHTHSVSDIVDMPNMSDYVTGQQFTDIANFVGQMDAEVKTNTLNVQTILAYLDSIVVGGEGSETESGHTHSNFNVLETITLSKIAEWDSKSSNDLTVNIEKYQHLVIDGDWTNAIQFAIDSGVKHLIFDEKTYFVSKRGQDESSKDYCVLINQKQNITIECRRGAKLAIDFSLDNLPNIFCIQNSSNVKLLNINGEGVKTRQSGNQSELYTGGCIRIYKSDHVVVDGGRFHNLLYGVQCFNSEFCTIQNTTFTHDYYRESWLSGAVPFSAIILYSVAHSNVLNNTIFGGLRDGDLSIFGGSTYKCTVQNNKLYGYGYDNEAKQSTYLGQGLTVDQGPACCHIIDNSIYGYYFGIDLKADTYDCLVSRNIIENCKCAIADRQGEATHVKETLGHIIELNKIIMHDSWSADYKLYGTYHMMGIVCEKRQMAIIRHNHITVRNITGGAIVRTPICGIYISGVDMHPHYQYPSQVIGNYIAFINSVRNIVTHAVSGSVAFHFKDTVNLNVTNNYFKANKENKSYRVFCFEGLNTSPKLLDNVLDCAIDHNTHITYLSGATSEALSVRDTTTQQTSAGIQLTNSTFTPICTLDLPYNDVSIIRVKGAQNWGGVRYVDMSFLVSRNETTITLTELNGTKSNLTFDGVVTDGVVQIRCKAESNLTRGMVFVIELHSQHNHKLI